jgi:hypothetical protein
VAPERGLNRIAVSAALEAAGYGAAGAAVIREAEAAPGQWRYTADRGRAVMKHGPGDWEVRDTAGTGYVIAGTRPRTAVSAWVCESCGWPWPLATAPPDGAECDSCGGELAEVTERV